MQNDSGGVGSLDVSTDVFHDASQNEPFTPHRTPAFTKAMRGLKDSMTNFLAKKKMSTMFDTDEQFDEGVRTPGHFVKAPQNVNTTLDD